MFRHTFVARAAAAALAAALIAPVAHAQSGGARLWLDPKDIGSRDLFWGPAAEARAPKGPFTFVEEDGGGTQPKIILRDAGGREWTAKFGDEVHAEIAASRIVWALGYVADELYFVPEGRLTSATSARMASSGTPASSIATPRSRVRIAVGTSPRTRSSARENCRGWRSS
jgi:hypothetical protein